MYSHFVINLRYKYLSASSSTIISTVCKLNDGVLCKWSTSLPGVAITMSGPLRNAASWPLPSKPPGKSLRPQQHSNKEFVTPNFT